MGLTADAGIYLTVVIRETLSSAKDQRTCIRGHIHFFVSIWQIGIRNIKTAYNADTTGASSILSGTAMNIDQGIQPVVTIVVFSISMANSVLSPPVSLYG